MANSKRKCKYCKEYSTEWITVPAGTFCTIEHVTEWVRTKDGKASAERVRKASDNEHKKRTKQLAAKWGVGKGKSQKDLTQDAFNRWIKLEEILRCNRLGTTPECISCGKKWSASNNSDFAAGHYYTRAARSDLALNTLNVNLQDNKRCNKELSGNIHGAMNTRGYTEGLKLKHGDNFDTIISHLERVRIVRYSDDDYKRCRKWLSARNRAIEAELN